MRNRESVSPSASYAVVWSEGGGARHAGRLDLREEEFELAGSAAGHRRSRRCRYDEIASVGLLAGRITIARRVGLDIEVASVDRPGALRELAGRLGAAA
jgi:hypothetical protein